jgi:hypothetical protein
MPRRRKEGREWTGIAIILVAVLLLKGFGVLKTLFNIDPDGVTFSIDVGFITSAALFIFVLTRMHKLNDVISKQGERIAKIEGMLTAESPKDK